MLNISRRYSQAVILHVDGDVKARYVAMAIKDIRGNKLTGCSEGLWESSEVTVDRQEIYISKYPGRLEKELRKFIKVKS